MSGRPDFPDDVTEASRQGPFTPGSFHNTQLSLVFMHLSLYFRGKRGNLGVGQIRVQIRTLPTVRLPGHHLISLSLFPPGG